MGARDGIRTVEIATGRVPMFCFVFGWYFDGTGRDEKEGIDNSTGRYPSLSVSYPYSRDDPCYKSNEKAYMVVNADTNG